MNSSQLIVFSDLDGTLLDHFTYQSDAALLTLEKLQAAKIPVILNTSKTLAETELISRSLSLNTPFIIENGAAIYIPQGTFDKQPTDTKTHGKYWVKSFGLPRKHWLDLLSERAPEYSQFYKGFSSLSDFSLSKVTGLTMDQARLAKQRQYGEPIQWLGDESSKKQFINCLISSGANVVQGGRFIHIGDFCDKGKALNWLTTLYRENMKSCSISTIALGDGENDISMLEASDIPVQIRSPAHSFPTILHQSTPIQTKLYGPEGWAEALQLVLSNHFNNKLEVNHG